MPLKKPTTFFSEKRQQEAECQRALEVAQPARRFRSPSDIVGEVKETASFVTPKQPRRRTTENIVERINVLSDVVPEDNRLWEELSGIQKSLTQLNLDKLERSELITVVETIETLKEALHKIEVPDFSHKVDELEGTYKNINDDLLENRLSYGQLRDKIESLVIPDIATNVSEITELRELHEEIKGVVLDLPNQKSRFDPSSILESLSVLRDSITETSNKIDTIRTVTDYTDDLDLLQAVIAEVKGSIKYYDSDVDDLRESITDLSKHLGKTITEKVKDMHDGLRQEDRKIVNKFNKKINALPEVKYYDDEIFVIEEKINGMLKSLNDIPEVKYYDDEIKSLSTVVEKLTKKVDNIKIVDWSNTIKDIQTNISEMQKISESYDKKLSLVEETVENAPDPLRPDALDNYVTFDEMQEHYRGFISRIQTQLSTLGGGGAVNILDMDDVDINIRQNPQDYDGDLLQIRYDPVTKRTMFVPVAPAQSTTNVVVGDAGINDLNDIDISAITNGSLLSWNSTTQRWVAIAPQSLGINNDANPDITVDDYGSF